MTTEKNNCIMKPRRMLKHNMNITTPFYVIHKKELDTALNDLKTALNQFWNNYIIGYSYKTNALPWIISYLHYHDCFAEIVSDDELALSSAIGVPLNRVIYNGPMKTKSSFICALKHGAYVNIDSQREIDWLDSVPHDNYHLGLRVNFDIERTCPNQSQCGLEGGRFGFCYENGEFEEALKRILVKGFELKGLHLHVSSKSRGIDIYKSIANIACEIAKEYNLKLDFIDIGGGFFGGLPEKPSFSDYFSDISDILKQFFSPITTKLIVEPGMALIGSPVSYVTSVIDVKDTNYNRFVITDGSRTNIDPLMTKSNYFYRHISRNQMPKLSRQIVCGYTCMEHDRLFNAVDDIEFSVGDKIIYDKVGAYTMCLTPLFIKYFPAVYVEDDGELKLVRRPWTSNEYLQNSLLFSQLEVQKK